MFLIEAKGPEWRNEKHRAQWRMTRCRFRRPGATATVRHKFEVWFGGYPLVSLADARKARDAAEQLVQAGQDPITEREEAERAKLAKPDFWPDGRCETIDHLPAKIIFPNKSRPKGLEFPACKRCNSQTKSEEALLALVCRMAGSLRKNAVPDIDRAKDLWSTVDQVYPGLPQRMVKSREERTISGIIRPVSIIDLNQPEIAPALCRVAAKFAQAVYYEAYGRPSPEGTRINTTWSQVFNKNAKAGIDFILREFPVTLSLHAGKWKTDDSFFLKTAIDDSHVVVAAIFHEAVVLAADLMVDEPAHPSVPWMNVLISSAANGLSFI